MDELAEVIRGEIGAAGGVITFERFMDLALYHPTFGYYRRQSSPIGREGDFITSVSVGPMFGKLLGKQLEECWNRLDQPEVFHVFEQGSGDKQLAADITSWCREQAPQFFKTLRYEFIEHDGAERPAGKGERCGLFFSNELVDAFPVHRVTRQDGHWHELGVASIDDRFQWRKMEPSGFSLAKEVTDLPEIEGYTTEINLRAQHWMEQTAALLDRGYFITIDYGFPASVYYAPFRSAGTLTAYRDHRRTDDVLRDPGQQDITAHVDFTALSRAGESAGLETLGFVDQQRFLTGIAEDELGRSGLPAAKTGPSAGIAENPRAWQTLTHPNHFGTRFQVLVQGKNVPSSLAGLKFARPGGLD